MPAPQDCQSMAEIRTEIDALDRQIVALLGQRFEYVKAAAPFKTSLKDVQAQERFEAILRERRTWAEAEGLEADVIEKMYRDLVTYFIKAESEHWQDGRRTRPH
jgi:isochorismate pyruvate lyase